MKLNKRNELSLRELKLCYKGLEDENTELKDLNATYKENIGNVIASGKYAIDSMNHEKTENTNFLKGLFKKSKKQHKGGFNTIGETVKLSSNIGAFKRADPGAIAAKEMKQAHLQSNYSNRPTTQIDNIDDISQNVSPEKDRDQSQNDEFATPDENNKVEVDDEDIVYSDGGTPEYDVIDKEEADEAKGKCS